MAYFPNGSSGAILDNQCAECPACDDEHKFACPIIFAQMEFNYDQCGNDTAERILNSFVNQQGICQMKPIIGKLTEKALRIEHDALIAEALED